MIELGVTKIAFGHLDPRDIRNRRNWVKRNGGRKVQEEQRVLRTCSKRAVKEINLHESIAG